MNKFYDYLMPDMSLPAIGALVRYIRRFTAAMGGDIPVEGRRFAKAPFHRKIEA